jgi:hypothetical protein
MKLLVTLKCLLPVMRPAKNPTHLKRVVKEKWDEVNRQRNRRVRWTIGGDRIEIDYEVLGTNTAALPTVNALFHSIVSTHFFLATIDIVDYYLGASLPSPESVQIDVSSISLPTLTKLGLLPFLRHSHGKPFLFCDVLKTVPGLPQSGLLSQLRLVSLLTQHGYSETSTPMLFRHHTHSTAFSLVVDDFLIVRLIFTPPNLTILYPVSPPSMNSKFIETVPATLTSAIPSTTPPPPPPPA